MEEVIITPETVLKKSKKNAFLKRKTLDLKNKQLLARKSEKKEEILHAERFVKDYRERQKSFAYYKRMQSSSADLGELSEGKIIFVIRIKGNKQIPKQVERALNYLKLSQQHSGVFLKVTKATYKLLKKIEPYITYGYPNKKCISELIYKRGYIRNDAKREPIDNNTVVEKLLGDYDIICIEDLVNEIYTGGKHIIDVLKLLWPFILNIPDAVNQKSRSSVKKGGDWGNREHKINDLIMQIL